MKRFVPNDESEALEQHKVNRSNKRTKNKASQHHSSSHKKNLETNANRNDLQKRVKDLESVVKKISIDLNSLRNNIDILRKQVMKL